MPLEKAGVEFVAAGYNEFIRKMGSASESIVETADAIVNLGKMTENRLAAMGKLNDALAIIGDTTQGMSEDMVSLAKSSNTATDSTNRQAKALESLGRAASKSGGLLGSLGSIVTGAFQGAKIGVGLGVLIPTVGEEIPLAIVGAVIGGLSAAFSEIGSAIDDFWSGIAKKLSDAGNFVVKVAGAGMKVVSAIYEMGKKIVGAAGNVMRSVINALTFGALGSGSFRSLGDSVFAAMLKFELLKQVVRKVIQEFKDYTRVAYEAAEILQTLTIRLDNLIARQMRNIGLTDNYADSIEKASGYTQELLGWISELSIATPFGVDIVSETVSLSMAMGWGIDATKELTNAILDYSAAQGLGNDVMERIIYNFAQMRQAGKVTGTELRDLARGAFMPINDILNIAAENLGIAADSMEEFREAAASGAIDVETFFDAFVTLANKEFPDAARNMNFTMAAVIDNIKDIFRVFIGWNMLKPMLDSVASRIQKLVDSINTPQVQRATKLIGMALQFLADSAMRAFGILKTTVGTLFQALGFGLPTLENVIKTIIRFGASIELVARMIQRFVYNNILPTFKNMGDDISGTMDSINDDAFSWGFNLIIEFGKGIMKGISTFLTAVMNALSGFLSGWLMGHSPPRIAPDIDLWGLNTIAEWLRGFTEADFSVLDSLKDNLKGALGALVDLGVIDEEISADMYVNISADLVGAIEEFNRTGEMTAIIFEQLRTVSGVFGEELVTLLNMQVELAEATERVAIAQEAYNAAVEATKQSTHLVNSSIRQYNALLRAGTDNSILEQRLAEINAAEMQLALDREMEAAADAELQAAEDALDPIREMVALQEELIQQLIDLAEAQAEAAEAAADAGGGGGGAGGGEEAPALDSLIDFGELEKQKGSLLDWFSTLKDEALEELGSMWANLKEQWIRSFNENFGPGSEFSRAWNKLVGNLKTVWDKFATKLGLPSWDEIAGAFAEGAEGETGLAAIVEGLTSVWTLVSESEFGQKITDIANGIKLIGDALAWVGTKPAGIAGLAALVGFLGDPNLLNLSLLATAAAFNWGVWVNDVLINPLLAELGMENPESIAGRFEFIGYQLPRSIFSGIVNAFTSRMTEIGTIIDTYIIGPVSEALGIGKGGEKNGGGESSVFAGIGETIVTSLYSNISEFLVNSWTTVEDSLMGFLSSVLDFFGIGKGGKVGGGSSSIFLEIGTSLVTGLTEGFSTAVASVIGAGGIIATKINDIINGVKGLLGITGDGDSSVFSGIGTSVMDGLKAGMESAFGSIESFLRDLISQLPDWAKEWLGIASPSEVFSDIGEDIIGGLGEGIGLAAHDYIDAASPSRLFSEIGRSTMTGMAQGILSASGRVYDAMESVISSSAIAPAMTMNATVRAPEVGAGGNSVSFGDVYLSDRLDLATLKSYVQSMILER